jgi:hypothetical protein
MSSPLPGNTSQTARLLNGAPSFAVGWQARTIVPAPAAGAQWQRVTDGRYFERVLAITFILTTSAAVANRFPVVQLVDHAGSVVTTVPAGGTVVASSTLNVNLAVGAPAYSFGAAGGTYGFLPDLLVPPGWSWQSATAGMDAGDAYSLVSVLSQQFPNDTAIITAE